MCCAGADADGAPAPGLATALVPLGLALLLGAAGEVPAEIGALLGEPVVGAGVVAWDEEAEGCALGDCGGFAVGYSPFG